MNSTPVPSLKNYITLLGFVSLFLFPHVSVADIIIPERALGGNTATLTYRDTGHRWSGQGNLYDYDVTIPYIQTSDDLYIKVDNWPNVSTARFEIEDIDGNVFPAVNDTGINIVDNSFEATFTNLPKDEYIVRVFGLDTSQNVIDEDIIEGIGIGDIIWSIGDSLTQGTSGNEFGIGNVPTDWTQAPAGNMSLDNRNFPQPGATGNNTPPVAFTSFQPRLNDYLSECYDYPVFIMNEGWAGHSSVDYAAEDGTNFPGDINLQDGHMITNEWGDRFDQLQPNKAIIELGANDAIERDRFDGGFVEDVQPFDQSVIEFNSNMGLLVNQITGSAHNHSIPLSDIWIATPTYAVYPYPGPLNIGSPLRPNYQTYVDQVPGIIGSTGTEVGPDFYDYYFRNQQLLSFDNIHPDQDGYDEKAREWAKVLTEGETGAECDYRISSALVLGKEITARDISDPSAVVGDTIDYKITLQNNSNPPVQITGITIIDPLFVDQYPGGNVTQTCFSSVDNAGEGTLDPGGIIECTLQYSIDDQDLLAEVVNNNVEVMSDNAGTVTASAPPENLTVIVQGVASLGIEKIITDRSYVFPDAPEFGSTIMYSITVTNTGTELIEGIEIADILDSDPNNTALQCDPFPQANLGLSPADPQNNIPADQITCTLLYVIQTPDLDAGGVLNLASATGFDSSGNVIIAEGYDEVLELPNLEGDELLEMFEFFGEINVTKEVFATNFTESEVIEGDTISYTIAVMNVGNTPVTDIVISDPLIDIDPAQDCDAFTIDPGDGLNPGDRIECNVVYSLDENDLDLDSITNTVAVTAKDYKGNKVNDEASVEQEIAAIDNNQGFNLGRPLVRRGLTRRSVYTVQGGSIQQSFSQPFIPTPLYGSDMVLNISPNWERCDCSPEVQKLQQWLNVHGFDLTAEGLGSRGNESQCFGYRTEMAVIRFQETYLDWVLAPLSLESGTGYFGWKTLSIMQAIDRGEIPLRNPMALWNVTGTAERYAVHGPEYTQRTE